MERGQRQLTGRPLIGGEARTPSRAVRASTLFGMLGYADASPASAATRKPMLAAEESGVLEDRAATR